MERVLTGRHWGSAFAVVELRAETRESVFDGGILSASPVWF